MRRKLIQRPYYHGDKNATAEEIGSKILWTNSNPNVAATYGKDVYALSIPEGTPMVRFEAKGSNWGKLKGLEDGIETTNDIAYKYLKDNNVVYVKNISDPGPVWWSKELQSNFPPALPNETLEHYVHRTFMGDDLILGPNIPRKSLLGNNGNFDIKNKNIYKSLVPFGLFGTAGMSR